MKVLYYTVLFVVLIGYAIASSESTGPEFGKAVDKEQLEDAVKFWKDGNASDDNAKYLVANAKPEFIVEFTKQASFREHIVAALYTSGSEETRKQVFEGFSFEGDDLIWATKDPDIPCRPEHLHDLLGRITEPEGKNSAIDVSIEGLFKGNRTGCVNPLLDSFKHEKDLEYRAIRTIFLVGVYHGNTLAKHYYGHPAVTPTDYSKALVMLISEQRTTDPIFEFLLKEADRNDWRALLDNEDYKQLNSDDRNAANAIIIKQFLYEVGLLDPERRHALIQAIVNQGLPPIKPGGSRHSTWEKANVATE